MSKKKSKAVKVYNSIGIFFCGCAGAIVGYVVGGPVIAILGVFAGIAVGHYLEKQVLKPSHS